MSIERVGTYRILCGSCGSSYRVTKGEDDRFPSCYVCGHGLSDDNTIMVEWSNSPIYDAVQIMKKAKQTKEEKDAETV
jgi:hypothetical protein